MYLTTGTGNQMLPLPCPHAPLFPALCSLLPAQTTPVYDHASIVISPSPL